MGLALILFNHHKCYVLDYKSYLGDRDTGSGLPPAHAAQPGLVLHDAVRHPHLTAERGQEHHHLAREMLIFTRSNEINIFYKSIKHQDRHVTHLRIQVKRFKLIII